MTQKNRTLNWISGQIELAETVLDNNPAKSKEVMISHERMMVLIRVAHELRNNPEADQWILNEIGKADQIVRKIGSSTNGAWNAHLEALKDAYEIYQKE